ncbi:uncharacterized protein LOC119651972 [Hermetia illucens]|uniref:uncharacterized protein LOC119651972 n=1 Tax=Hermetia illucens TaxID=343691 RepID=UPI0018CC3100|nr:uncharacterized protein LOC119651972 [Hermetia illucens]
MGKSVSYQIISSVILINVGISFAINQLPPEGVTTTTQPPTVSLPRVELPEGIGPKLLQSSPKPVNFGSSVVRSDGSFNFVTISTGVDIQIEGFLKDVNGTRSLVLTGEYTFLNYSRSFRADENGFQVYLPIVPAQLPIKVLQTITGR